MMNYEGMVEKAYPFILTALVVCGVLGCLRGLY